MKPSDQQKPLIDKAQDCYRVNLRKSTQHIVDNGYARFTNAHPFNVI